MQAKINARAKAATISNGLIEMEIDVAGGLRLRHLRHCATGRDWIPQPPDYPWGTDRHLAALVCDRRGLWPDLAPPSREFLLRYSPCPPGGELVTVAPPASGAPSGQTLTGASASRWVPKRSSATVQRGRARLSLTMALTGHPLEVTVHTELPKGVPLARRWASVRNTGREPLLLHRLTSLLLAVRPGANDLDLSWVEAFIHPGVEMVPWRQATVHQERLGAATRRTLRYGAYPRPHGGSYGCLGWLALRDPALDEGLFCGWEWSGVFDAEVGDLREGAGVCGLRAGFSDEGGYARRLDPGETFDTPVAFAGFFRGSVEEAGRATRHAAEQLFGLPWPDKQPPMFVGYDTWSNWQDFRGSTKHLRPERLAPEVRRARELGCELFILDYDWFPLLGDFVSDRGRFPRGVEAVARQVKAAGMKFGLWMGFGQVHQDAPVAREHPEWLVTRGGKAVLGGWGMYALCLGYPPCRDWVLETVSRVMRDFGVDWLKHDFDLIPISDAHPHAPRATDSRIESVAGYYHILDELHRRFPRLYLDNWTPPLGGADFGNFQRHHSTLVADWYTPVAVRSMCHGITHLFPPTRQHAYLRTFSRQDEVAPYAYRSGFFGNGLYLLNDLLQWDRKTMAVVKREIERIKADRPLFIKGEVYNLIDRPPDHFGWEARFVYDGAAGRGMAQVFRNHDPESSHRIVFRGLDPQTEYEVSLVDARRRVRIAGNELLATGLEVRLPKPFSSEIVRLRAVAR